MKPFQSTALTYQALLFYSHGMHIAFEWLVQATLNIVLSLLIEPSNDSAPAEFVVPLIVAMCVFPLIVDVAICNGVRRTNYT